jgi:hypothetical protein
MHIGPLERCELAPSSFDVVVLMDVLEHLPDPLGTMRRAFECLAPDGVFVVQTPRYPAPRPYQALAESNHPFIAQMSEAMGHLYLFSSFAVRELFRRMGCKWVQFEAPIFGHYDMFVVAARERQVASTLTEVEGEVGADPRGRLALLLLDLDCDLRAARTVAKGLRSNLAERDVQLRNLQEHFQVAEADREARLEVIEAQGERLGCLDGERNVLASRVADLEQHLAEAEADREPRL